MLKPFHLVAALPFVLSACASYQSQSFAQGCSADSAERVQAADWAKVKTISVRIRRDEFVPMVVTLTQGRPYVMRLENVDRESHAFRAPEFFKAIAMEGATVGDRELAEGCLKHVILEAGETAEFRFVAVRDGHYDFKDSRLPFSFGGEAIGVIAIEPRQAFTVGALNPLNIEETPPPETPAPPAPSNNPFDTYEPPAAESTPLDAVEPAPAEDKVSNPFDAVEPAPAEDKESNPFDAVEPAPAEDKESSPFETVEPAPAEDTESNPFETVEPVPAESRESNPFDVVEPAPADVDAPAAMVQAMPPGPPAPPPEMEDVTDPFGAMEPDRSLPLE